MDDIERLETEDGDTLAYRRVEGAGPTVLWVGGYRSDMEGTKALALDAAARERGWTYVRYDHFAHGRSSGDWRRATIGRWREDLLRLIDHIDGPVIPVGSSMGGWVALHAAQARRREVVGLVLINPAQDFTERLMWPSLRDHEREAILRDGEATIADPGLGDYVLTRRFFEEAKDWLMLDGVIRIEAPTHILQGREDDVVPWRHQVELLERLTGADVVLERIEAGDHRLSDPPQIDRLIAAIEAMRRRSAGPCAQPAR
ncbi:MAG: alpha/beta fold hydrolase [Brevundimonas sp.]